jgi:dihydroflavonol-4-reductase
MKLAITGATGFIGARFAERWLEAGGELRALVRRSSRVEALRGIGAELVEVDLERGLGLEEALRGADAVLHLAGAVRAWSPSAYRRANAESTRNLALAARRVGVGRFLLVSSLAAAGPATAHRALTEADPPRPVVPYGESKLLAEHHLAEAAGDALSWAVVRPTIVYGPGDRDVLQLFRLCRHRLVPFAAPPDARISLIHVDDLVELLLICLQRAPSGGLYFASDGGSHAWPEVLRAIGAGLGREVRPLRLSPALLWPLAAAAQVLRPFLDRPPVLSLDKLREARERSWLCSPEKAARELGFRPRIGLEQ